MSTAYDFVVDDDLGGFGSLIPLKVVCRMFGWTPEQVRPELARRKDLVPFGADGGGVFLVAEAGRAGEVAQRYAPRKPRPMSSVWARSRSIPSSSVSCE